MKIIHFLKYLTIFEIFSSIVLGALTLGSFYFKQFTFGGWSFCILAGMHVISMLLHWLGWKVLPTTHTSRVIFNVWVIGTFAAIALSWLISPSLVFMFLYLLLLFAIAWFVYYTYILYMEYSYLKRKEELYSQRELIHF